MAFCGPFLGIKAEWLVFFVIEKGRESPEHADYSKDYVRLLLYFSQATSISRSEEPLA